MKISDFLSPTDVALDVRVGDKPRLLQHLSAQAAAELSLNAEEVSSAIMKREELGSTGVGNGVALPHARLKDLKAPFGIFVRLRHAIDFEAIDDKPVDLVFLLLLPSAAHETQLNALACVARALRDPDTLHQVRGAPDQGALFQAIANSGSEQS
jgi:PTS system nitrogen regulatory IIA component